MTPWIRDRTVGPEYFGHRVTGKEGGGGETPSSIVEFPSRPRVETNSSIGILGVEYHVLCTQMVAWNDAFPNETLTLSILTMMSSLLRCRTES